MAVPIQISAVIDGLGVSEQNSAFLGTLEITCLSLVTILLAAQIGRWSKPKVAMVGLALGVAGQFLSATASGYTELLPYRVMVGVGAGLIYGAACACIAGLASGDRLFAWGMALGQLALVLMLFGLPFAASSFNDHVGVYGALGVLSLVTGFLLLKLPDNREEVVEEAKGKIELNVSVSTVTLFFVALSLFNIAIGMLWGFIELRASELMMDEAQVGLILAALPFGGVVGSMFAGIIGGRFGRVIPFVFALAACTAACFTVAFVESHSAMLLAILALGAFELFVVAFLVGTASVMDDAGRIATLAGGMIMLTYGFGPSIGGFLSSFLTVSQICMVSGLFCLVAALIALPVGLALDRRAGDSDLKVAH